MGDNAAIEIGKALEINKSLQYLHIGTNGILDAGVCSISTALQCNTTLLGLKLSGNSFPSALSSLLEALTINTTLEQLNISGNRFRDTEISAISEILECSNLKILSIRDNPFTTKSLEKILLALKRNQSLTELNFEN